jgi:PPOX class probable F420-dependent enzyme
MTALPAELRELIEAGPLVHLSTINPDSSPQVSVIWIGLHGDDLVSGHMSHYVKLRNIERDSRVVLSFDAPRTPGVFLHPYAVLHAHATVEPSDQAWELLNYLTKNLHVTRRRPPRTQWTRIHRAIHRRTDRRRRPVGPVRQRVDQRSSRLRPGLAALLPGRVRPGVVAQHSVVGV